MNELGAGTNFTLLFYFYIQLFSIFSLFNAFNFVVIVNIREIKRREMVFLISLFCFGKFPIEKQYIGIIVDVFRFYSIESCQLAST